MHTGLAYVDTSSRPPNDLTLDAAFDMKMPMRELERQYILRTLFRWNWNITRAAKHLGMNRRSLYRRIDEWDLRRFKNPYRAVT